MPKLGKSKPKVRKAKLPPDTIPYLPTAAPEPENTRAFVAVAKVYRASMAKLESYANRVGTGADLQPALEFAQFIICSGIITLCQEFSRDEPSKADASHLQRAAEELQRAVKDKLKNPKDPKVIMDLLEEINHRLGLIAGHVAKSR